jgi:mannose/fructose/N-acetylgalactosamine-specific phosphotransferase system component IID
MAGLSGILDAIFYVLCTIFTILMNESIVSIQEITDSLFPQAETIEFVTLIFWVLSLFLWKK